MQPDLAEIKTQYAQLRARLGKAGWISQGYAQDRGPGAGGPCYQWTRKVKGKTVSVALSKEQYEALQQAIENWRALQDILRRMQQHQSKKRSLLRALKSWSPPRPAAGG